MKKIILIALLGIVSCKKAPKEKIWTIFSPNDKFYVQIPHDDDLKKYHIPKDSTFLYLQKDAAVGFNIWSDVPQFANPNDSLKIIIKLNGNQYYNEVGKYHHFTY